MTGRAKCPGCRGEEVEVFFELDGVPCHCHVQHAGRADALAAPRGALRLGFCPACGLVFNIAFEPERMRYTPLYDNALHNSPRFDAYARELATSLVERRGLRGRAVLEIGCGDGHFLRLLRDAGARRGVGFDPACAAADEAELAFVREPFRATAVRDPVDFVCCRHVLEHVYDPRAFLAEVARAPDRAKVVFFEVPDAIWTLRDGGVWDLLYEHCLYFTAGSLARLFAEAGYEVLSTRTAFRGQYLQIEARAAPAPVAPASDLTELASLVARFDDRYRTEVGRWESELVERLDRGGKVALWGAGTKGVMFLNTVPAARRVGAVVDINPNKHGRFVAGTGHEIVAPAALRHEPPDAVLVMNPAYAEEIGSQLDDLGVDADRVVVG